MPGLAPVTFAVQPSGRVQLARTGSGFWRRDHGEPFSVDEEMLRLMLRNAQIRRRPIRVDFMHWANMDLGDDLGDYAKAAEMDPAVLVVEPWVEPTTGELGAGIFGPAAWTDEGCEAVAAGIDEISPVIDWAFVLPEDTPEFPAGTLLGPTIIGASLVDRGFFWMDKVRLYREGAAETASLYQEFDMAALTLAQFIAAAQALESAGIDDATALQMLDGVLDTGEAPGADAGDMAATDGQPAAPAAGVPAAPMAARSLPLVIPGARRPIVPAAQLAARAPVVVPAPAAPAPAPAAPAQVAPVAPAAPLAARAPAAPARTGIGALMAALSTPRPALAAPAAAPQGTQGYADRNEVAELRAEVGELTEAFRALLVRELDREGRLVGISDPMRLMREAPGYFAEQIAGRTVLPTQAAPAAPPVRPLRAVAGSDDPDQFAREVSAYREAQAKTGRKLTQAQAIQEYEQLRAQPAAAR